MSLCGALITLAPQASFAQLAHPGYSGLISTPNEDVVPQGQIALGFSLIDGPGTYLFAPKTNRLYVVTVGILPGLETTLRQTQVIGWYPGDAPGVAYGFDRMFSAKYALATPEGFPNVAFGLQDIASGNFLAGVRGSKPGVTQYGQSTFYGVVGNSFSNWRWHGGIGISQAFINGLFGGISYYPLKRIQLLGEWDGRAVNLGVRFQLFEGCSIQLSSINQTTIGLSSELQIKL